MSTKIIATIGPSSLNPETLNFFKNHSVQYARLNYSHGTSEWHLEANKICREAGLEILMDLGGPKIRMGEIKDNVLIESNQEVYLEFIKEGQTYPTEENGLVVLPTAVNLTRTVEPGREILIDDGKLNLQVIAIEGSLIRCKVIFGGIVRSRKGINIPGKSADVEFLTSRDQQMLKDTLVEIRPNVVACSFVRSEKDVQQIKSFIQGILAESGITDYFPLICPKIEQYEAVQTEIFEKILAECDLVMIARGDLALETLPVHINVPFYQEQIKNMCCKADKPFIVATQILESMIENPVPTRAEISDLYRAVVIDQADYVMLSAESAMGKFARQSVGLMHTMITQHQELSASIQR